jgi:hypothetical protein
MAGLATLTLAAAIHYYYYQQQQQQQQQQQKYPVQSCQSHSFHCYITDGNIDCVQNNEINVSIMRWMNVLPSSLSSLAATATAAAAASGASDDSTSDITAHNNNGTIQMDCRQLIWSYYIPMDPDIVADLTLISDCVHFETYHGELLWTIVTHTCGKAIFCQPNRTPSLPNFLQLIDHVNNDSVTNRNDKCGPLVQMTEQILDPLQEKHDLFMMQQQQQATNGDNEHNSYDYYYDPDKHRPRIYIMDVLRRPNEYDRHCIMSYCRDTGPQ